VSGGTAAGSGDRDDPLRRRIAAEAARGVAAGSDAKRAVFRAARRLTRGWVPPERLPTTAEVNARAQLRLHPGATDSADRLGRIAGLVSLLATVRRDPAAHPEGDALDHALQVFDLVHATRPYDEELLTAALVQEVGLVFDRDDPVAAGIEALGDLVTPRTRWLVEFVAAARGYRDGTLGHRARLRLEGHPDFEAVLALAEADRKGRVRGGMASTLDEAIMILRALDDADLDDADVSAGPDS
jgi:hypothetical protein